RDSMGMHSDDEPELGRNPVITSLSLGAPRVFTLKHKLDARVSPVKLELGDGSLLIMAGATQHYWKHGIAKTARPVGPRINLTFRTIRSAG
ncbi:MAG TPA: alpha-ketoglutarate-dependent dioxygenase AlkB, partial [Burkholderiaceae bacterium]